MNIRKNEYLKTTLKKGATIDANGNMTIDNNKGISSITYNHLNLPKSVNVGGGTIDYVYDATGIKLSKKVIESGNPDKDTYYAGNYIYENNDLPFFNTSEGYASPNNLGKFDYIYQHKDHLGNVRLSYTEVANTLESTPVFSDSFESITNWNKSPTTIGYTLSAIDNTKKRTGDYSGRIDPVSSNSDIYVYSDQWVSISNTEATDYTFSVWVYLEDVVNNSAEIFLSTRKQGETTEWGSGIYHTLTKEKGGWFLLERTVKILANVVEMRVRIDNNNGGKVWFDDIKIVKGNASPTVVVEESNYYPFGLEHRGYNNVIVGVKNNLKHYQGQEFTEDLGLNTHEWKYRVSDPAIGRFWQIDPLSEQYSYQSPYNFSENRVIDAFELEGLEKVSIHTQSFAPFDYFGFVPPFGPFVGDMRTNFQANPNASSRISGRVDLNLSGNGITQTGQGKNGSVSVSLGHPIGGVKKSAADFTSTIGEQSTSNGTTAATSLGFHLSGNNSLVPGSPDIDVKGTLGIGIAENKDGTSTAVVSGKIFGDKFPANETFLTDAGGASVFLGVSGAILGPNAGPAFALPGNNSRTMSTFTLNINFGADGNINTKNAVQFNGTNYSLKDWNKLFESQNPRSGSTSSNFD